MNETIYILGISAYFHDSAAALIKDGEVIVAIQEERLTRVKQDSSLPVHAIQFCLDQAGVSIENISQIAYYEKPFLKFERLLETQIRQYPAAFLPFRKTVKTWLKDKLWVPHNIRKATGFKGDFFYSEHHESHVAAACYSAPFDEAAFLTLDGVGEWTCASYGVFEQNQIQMLAEQKYPHSVGMLYSAFTQYCGFRVNSGEYKLMGLAPYGEPKYVEKIKSELLTIHEDGSITLNLKYFQFQKGMRMINGRFERLFGKAKRRPETNMTQFYKDIAASVQVVLEDIVLTAAKHIRVTTGKANLCYGGGVALNCKANQRLVESGIFDEVHIYSASGDAGGAIGTGLLAWNQNRERNVAGIPSYLGREFTQVEINAELEKKQVQFTVLKDEELLTQTAGLLNEGKVIAWHQGRDEMGPRALGNRSILASPKNPEMKQKINEMIKFRENFRPFAPVILEEHAANYFSDVKNANEMLYTFNCTQTEYIGACVHEDGSARVQTVNVQQNKRLYELLGQFYAISDVPVLINTSFNRRGEPMVHSPEDALRTFFGSGLDVLVIGNAIIQKHGNEHVQITDRKLELD